MDVTFGFDSVESRHLAKPRYKEEMTLKENVLEVLIYLFENYMADGGVSLSPNDTNLTRELVEVGFERDEIDMAFLWLDGLLEMSDKRFESDGLAKGMRVYRKDERERIPLEAQSLLLRLERAGVLDVGARELIIDRIMALDIPDIEIDDVKWVIMMVLCNRTEYPEVIEWAESLVTESQVSTH